MLTKRRKEIRGSYVQYNDPQPQKELSTDTWNLGSVMLSERSKKQKETRIVCFYCYERDRKQVNDCQVLEAGGGEGCDCFMGAWGFLVVG